MRRVAFVVVIAGALGLTVWMLWPYLVGGTVLYAAWRVVRRDVAGARRRRPRSSWSSLGRTAALMYGAWNTRWLKPTSPIKAKVHRSADGGSSMPVELELDAGTDIPY